MFGLQRAPRFTRTFSRADIHKLNAAVTAPLHCGQITFNRFADLFVCLLFRRTKLRTFPADARAVGIDLFRKFILGYKAAFNLRPPPEER